MARSIPRKEMMLAIVLLAFGIFCVPALVYVVGQYVFGDYEGERGLTSFYQAIGNSLIGGNPATWLLVLSPYLLIQLVRLGAFIRRRPRA